MNRNFSTLILVIFCFIKINANNTENTLYIVYSENCSYSQDLLENTISNEKIKKELDENFNYKLLEENTSEAKLIIEKYDINGFPTQVLVNNNKSVFAFGALSIESQLKFLSSSNNLESIYGLSNENEIEEMTPFEEFVFRETGLGYNINTKEFLTPSVKFAYNRCRKEENPDIYICGGKGGASYTFINKENKDGDFKVAVFHPTEKARNSMMAISTFVENGKVIQQSRCFHRGQWNRQIKKSESHYKVTKMECYTVIPKLCKILNGIKSLEDGKEKSRFEDFIEVLKSTEYKKAILDAQKYNYRSAFLKMNREENYDFYSKLEDGFFNIEKEGLNKELKIVEFEKSLYVKNSKNLYDVVSNANALFSRVFYEPCRNLVRNKLMDE